MGGRRWDRSGVIAALLLLAPLALTPASAARDYSRTCIDCDIPWAWDDAPPPPVAPFYPQGFALTVPLRPNRPGPGPASHPVLTRYRDVGDALGMCWNPDADLRSGHWHEVTLRTSFKRDGTVNGVPRVVYVSATAEPKTRESLAASLLAALSACTPLNVSPSLGNAIAGQIFAIRFIQG